VPGKMPLGQSNFIKNLISFFTQKKKQLYCLKNIGIYQQNKLKIRLYWKDAKCDIKDTGQQNILRRFKILN